MKLLFHGPSAADIGRQQALFGAREHDRLSEDFLNIFGHYEKRTYPTAATFPVTLFPFLASFLELFASPEYKLTKPYVSAFLRYNTLISNLVAVSSLKSTDAHLESLRGQPGALPKILTLYSARNAAEFDSAAFFAEDPALASLWYYQYCGIHISGLLRGDVVRRVAAHLERTDDRLQPAQDMMLAYYGGTYIDPKRDRIAKRRINKAVQLHQGYAAAMRPQPGKIAVISDFWYPSHSVYRNYAAYVQSLKPGYHLTLFHTLTPREKLDTAMFDEVVRLDMKSRATFFDPLNRNFELAYFPDVGMTDPSIVLANCRIAAVQVSSPGHSVSSFGSQVDYFISGRDVEEADTPGRHYSERLVLLPGMGVVHNLPDYQPQGFVKAVPELVINCPWSSHKMCAPFMRTIAGLLARVERPVRLRIFPNDGVSMHNGYLPFLADLRAALGEKTPIDMLPGLSYAAYMAAMEEGDLTLDSFHFAGCNSVADSLYLRKPTLVRQGETWYNRIGPAMLRSIGMGECIATGEDDYLEKALLLIHDDAKRADVAARLASADLDATIFSTQHAPAFRRAIDYLIANHSQLRMREPHAPLAIS